MCSFLGLYEGLYIKPYEFIMHSNVQYILRTVPTKYNEKKCSEFSGFIQFGMDIWALHCVQCF